MVWDESEYDVMPPPPPAIDCSTEEQHGLQAGPPDCWQCRHFAISWQPAMPYQCRLMQFKSRTIPHLEVVRADGRPCQGYSPKPVAALR